MICDKLATFADNTALNTGAPGSFIVGDQIDLQVERNIGVALGHAQLWLVIKVAQTATSGGAATAKFDFVTDDNGSLTTPAVIASTPVFPVADLVAGTVLAIIAIPISDAYERFVGIQQVTAGVAFTGGAVDAFFTTTPPAYRAYPQGDGAAIA